MVTNCPNCGAPIDYSNIKCAYCDTFYPVSRTTIIKDVGTAYRDESGLLHKQILGRNMIVEVIKYEKDTNTL